MGLKRIQNASQGQFGNSITNCQLHFRIKCALFHIDWFRGIIYRPTQQDIPMEIISEETGNFGDPLYLDRPFEQGLCYQIFGYRNGDPNPVAGLYGSASELFKVDELVLEPARLLA